MTLGDIWTAASVELGIRADVAGEKQTLITRVANAGVLEILKRTKVHVMFATTTVTPGVGDYELPTQVLRLTQLLAPSSGGGLGPLEHVSPEEIDWRRRSASSSQDSTLLAYAVDGFNLFKVYPTPTTTYTLTLYYVPRPLKLSDAAHDPSAVSYGGIPEEFHEDTLMPYIYWKAGSQGDDQSSGMGQRYDQDFEKGVQELRKRINRRRGRLGPARTAYSRRRRVWANDQA